MNRDMMTTIPGSNICGVQYYYRIVPFEEPGKKRQTNSSHLIHSPRLDSPLYIFGKLPTKNQILGADGTGRTQEQQPQPQNV